MKEQINKTGFLIAEDIYSTEEIRSFIKIIESVKKANNDNFRQSKDLYAIRNLLKEVPGLLNLILNSKLKKIFSEYFDTVYFPVKGIYFDKPPLST